jgi:SAM-dependent MidA family methyltransferase
MSYELAREYTYKLRASPAWLALALLGLRGAFGQEVRPLLNPKELGQEVKVPPGTEAAVKRYFPTFYDYQDLMLFHPGLGYYSSGFVKFNGDWSTYPNILAPYFGQMIAEQSFRMWAGMRRAGTLGAAETFTIAEFGAGNGSLAESILDYINQKAGTGLEPRWRDFARQTIYASYDRSPAMNRQEQARNARFGKQFEARPGDATNPTAAIAPGSLKGIVLSNEMPDNFSVHKVVFSTSGSAEVAYVVPALAPETWSFFRTLVTAPVAQLVERDNESIQAALNGGGKGTTIFLSRASYVALLEGLASHGPLNYPDRVHAIRFFEIYLPVSQIPELARHVRQYARWYAAELSKSDKGFVTYINLGLAKFAQGAARILKAGYVLTIDYGSNWDGIVAFGPYGKLRTYGPGTVVEKPDPYAWPTLNDITTDVNFGHMAQEGGQAGLKTVYFGYQRALQSGTPVRLDTPPRDRELTDRQKRDFQIWSRNFGTLHSFKMLLQQKERTDPSYTYPDRAPLPLELNEADLSEAQRTKAAEIERIFMLRPD